MKILKIFFNIYQVNSKCNNISKANTSKTERKKKTDRKEKIPKDKGSETVKMKQIRLS